MSHQHTTSSTSTRPTTPSRRKWFVDLKIGKNERLSANNSDTHLATVVNQQYNIAPIGFSEQRVCDTITQEDDSRLLTKRSWDIALQPMKQLPMNVILAWMAGNSFSLMSIMIVLMLFMKPIQAIFSLSSAFSSLEQEGVVGNLRWHKLMFFLGNLTHLALALYKCQSMGLLPTYNSDWIAFADQQRHMEVTLGGLAYSS